MRKKVVIGIAVSCVVSISVGLAMVFVAPYPPVGTLGQALIYGALGTAVTALVVDRFLKR